MAAADDQASLEEALRTALRADNVLLSSAPLTRLAKLIQYSDQARKRGVRRLNSPAVEILTLIETARDAGEAHEAVWFAFLAAHFARLSASSKDGSAESAGRFLCAFGNEPVWTWSRVSSDKGKDLQAWIQAEPAVLNLKFGNHRSHEQPKVSQLMKTLRSFIDIALKMNGPANVVKAPGASNPSERSSNPSERFDFLFRTLIKIHRFGRLASWDFIDLLLTMKLVADAEPAHCYLEGATGPLKGARQVWGRNKSIEALNTLAARLASKLGVSCFILEDALCIFQKAGVDPCCGDPDDEGNCRAD